MGIDNLRLGAEQMDQHLDKSKVDHMGSFPRGALGLLRRLTMKQIRIFLKLLHEAETMRLITPYIKAQVFFPLNFKEGQAELTQRLLSNAANEPAGLQSHEDLARNLQADCKS